MKRCAGISATSHVIYHTQKLFSLPRRRRRAAIFFSFSFSLLRTYPLLWGIGIENWLRYEWHFPPTTTTTIGGHRGGQRGVPPPGETVLWPPLENSRDLLSKITPMGALTPPWRRWPCPPMLLTANMAHLQHPSTYTTKRVNAKHPPPTGS